MFQMTTWADEYMTMLEDCEKRSEKLTDWECSFVDSLQRQIADGRRPSAKQVETLEQAMSKKTNPNLTVGYGYVAKWSDGMLGHCLPEQLCGHSRRYPEPCAPHPEWLNIGEPSYLCKITIERVPNVRMRRIKE
jgi:hypothetical protein